MASPQVVIATTTLYEDPLGKDRLRFQLAFELVALARNEGHNVVVVDDSPNAVVREALGQLGAHVFPAKGKGLGAQMREAWQKVTLDGSLTEGTSAVISTEAEKPDLVRFIPEIVGSMKQEESKVVMVGRTKKSWSTYPKFQQEIEKVGSLTYNLLFPYRSQMVDAFFGSICIDLRMLHHFAYFDIEKYQVPDTYLHIFIPLFLRSAGWKTSCWNIDFVYPAIQRQDEEKARLSEVMEKKIEQLYHVIAACDSFKKNQLKSRW